MDAGRRTGQSARPLWLRSSALPTWPQQRQRSGYQLRNNWPAPCLFARGYESRWHFIPPGERSRPHRDTPLPTRYVMGLGESASGLDCAACPAFPRETRWPLGTPTDGNVGGVRGKHRPTVSSRRFCAAEDAVPGFTWPSTRVPVGRRHSSPEVEPLERGNPYMPWESPALRWLDCRMTKWPEHDQRLRLSAALRECLTVSRAASKGHDRCTNPTHRRDWSRNLR